MPFPSRAWHEACGKRGHRLATTYHDHTEFLKLHNHVRKREKGRYASNCAIP